MLDIDMDQRLNLDLQADIVGRRIAVLGVSGQGKTNTAAVLIEELLSNGFPLSIVDLEGEYWGLKEKYQILVVGRGEHVDLVAGPYQAAALAAASIMEGIPMILDLSDFSQAEQTDFLMEYFGSLWEAASKKRTPYEVILEEAHEFIPEGLRNPLKELLTKIALRGRKRGLGSIVMSQRSAKVAKDFLTQAEILFLHRVIHPVDLKVYKELIPLPARQVVELVGQLQTGQVVFVYNNEAQAVQIRHRHTFSAGSTPQLEAQVASHLVTIDRALLDKLAEVIRVVDDTAEASGRQDRAAQAARRIKELEEETAAYRAEVADLRQQLATLKDVRVSMDGPLILPAPVLLPAQPSGPGSGPDAISTVLAAAPGHRLIELPPPAANAPGQLAGTSGQGLRELNDYDKRRLNNFLAKLSQFSDRERIVMAYLLDHDGVVFSRSDLFQATGLLMNNFNRDFPRLVKAPFVVNRTTLPITIKTRLKEWSRTAFPGVDSEAIKREVMKTLR